jgi:hypothetical protein
MNCWPSEIRAAVVGVPATESPHGGGQQRLGDGEAEGFGGLEVDDELESCRPAHRQIAGLLAAENAAGIVAELPILLPDVGSLAHQRANAASMSPNLAGIDDLDFPPNWGGRSSHICEHRFDDGRVVVRVDAF